MQEKVLEKALLRLKRGLLIVLLTILGTSGASGDQNAPVSPITLTAPFTLEVWPGQAPGETTREVGRLEKAGDVLRMTDVTRPQILLFPAAGKRPRPAVLVCPGGGYSILAMDLEGTEIARWLNGLGFTAAVLEYRVPGKREGAFQDGQRALSLLRARAAELGIDPRRLGVLGFSAGGHLAARLAAGFGTRSYAAVDALDTASARPDFAALIYPAYLLDGAGLPSEEVKPRDDMPPLFLMQTMDDSNLDAPEYASALEHAGVPTRTAFYATGGHGYGLRSPQDKPVHAWPDEAAAWLKRLPPSAAPIPSH